MIRLVAALLVLASFVTSALADEHVIVATQRLPANGALFIADSRGYFHAEGIDIEMVAYTSEAEVAQAVASGAADVGLAAFSPQAFDYAGQGLIKFVAGQATEKRGYEGTDIVASNIAWTNGLRRLEDLAGKTVGYTGLVAQFQIAEIAQAKKLDFASLNLQSLPGNGELARAIAIGKVQAAILPPAYAHDLMVASEAKLIGWYSAIGEQQLGALFASAKMLEARRAAAEKFVHGYRRGAADYASMLELDRSGKRVLDVSTRELATIIARYAYPGRPLGRAAALVEATALPMDRNARLDVADLARQVEWYRKQKLIETAADANDMVDTELVNAIPAAATPAKAANRH